MREAFIEAIKTSDIQAVKKMIAADSTLADVKTDSGVSAILFSAYYGQLEISHLLRQHCTQLDIFEAAALGDEHAITQILATQPEVIDSFAPDGFTPLGLAAYFGHLSVVSLLISHNADVNRAANNPQQVTPLHSAVSRHHLQIAQVLLSNGADANARQQQGISPLQQAAHGGHLEMVKLLLDHGADANLTDDQGKTALDYAREDGHTVVVDHLTEHISTRKTT